MKIFIISDTHFGHKMLVEKGYREKYYEYKINTNLLKLNKEDLLIHLGDVCIGNDEENHNVFIKPLKCKKILVKGNHDRKSNNFYLNNGWDFVCHKFSDKFFGKYVLFSHKPKEDDGYDLNLFGHFHDSFHHLKDKELVDILTDKHRLIAIENAKYKPVLLESIILKDCGYSDLNKLFDEYDKRSL